MNFTIEQRGISLPESSLPELSAVVVQALDCEHALHDFVMEHHCKLLSYVSPSACAESIATVRQGEDLFVLRIYPN